MNVYYDHQGKLITKEQYGHLENTVDYGFKWFGGPRWVWALVIVFVVLGAFAFLLG